jgi:hypothetical protein
MYMGYICTRCYVVTYQGSLLTTMKPIERKKGTNYIIRLLHCYLVLSQKNKQVLSTIVLMLDVITS